MSWLEEEERQPEKSSMEKLMDETNELCYDDNLREGRACAERIMLMAITMPKRSVKDE